MTVIEVEHLHKRHGDVVAVQDVSFAVEEGEVFGIIGPNGAGKTTTVECLSGLRPADGGRLSVLGLDPRHQREALRRVLGVQLQESGLPDKLTVREALALFASFHERPADPADLMARLGLIAQAGTRHKELSGGQKQRLAVALALVGRPRAVILDELSTGLDPQARRTSWALVEQMRDSGVTVVLVTHFMEEAERLCDRVALIDAGRVAALGTPAALAARAGATRMRFRTSGPLKAELLRALPGVRAVACHGPRVEVAGDGDLVPVVTALLARHHVTPLDLRVEQSSLDDAFLALTGHAAA